MKDKKIKEICCDDCTHTKEKEDKDDKDSKDFSSSSTETLPFPAKKDEQTLEW